MSRSLPRSTGERQQTSAVCLAVTRRLLEDSSDVSQDAQFTDVLEMFQYASEEAQRGAAVENAAVPPVPPPFGGPSYALRFGPQTGDSASPPLVPSMLCVSDLGVEAARAGCHTCPVFYCQSRGDFARESERRTCLVLSCGGVVDRPRSSFYNLGPRWQRQGELLNGPSQSCLGQEACCLR